MIKNQTFVEDILTLGGNIMGNLLGARHEMRAQTKQRIERLMQQLNLVTREEFDATFSMLSKARMEQEKLQERLNALESSLGKSNTNSRLKAGLKSSKKRLPSVKKDKRRTKA